MKSLPEEMAVGTLDSPVGTLAIIASDAGIHAITWERTKPKDDHPLIDRARRQLEEYFEGKRTRFDLPLAPRGTPFQLRAWRELARIPYGKTISYEEQARRLGNAKAMRAVGLANGKNPIGIVVPCHRVIAKSGKLAGFGGGIENKRFLLDLERQRSNT